MSNLLNLILKLNPLDVTPELATLRDSLIVERLNESSEKIRELLEGAENTCTLRDWLENNT